MKHSAIRRQYVLDENNKKIAVMLDINLFEKMEEALENYGLIKFMEENKNEKPLTAAEAKTYYRKLKKGE